jgi:hypothetical protein
MNKDKTTDYLDPNWTIHNDRQSVTVGINTRIRLLRKKGMQPTLIRLGRENTRLFLREHSLQAIPNKKPRRLISGHLFWDEENRQLCYSKAMIPIQFNDSKIIGIAVEGEPISTSSTRSRKAGTRRKYDDRPRGTAPNSPRKSETNQE